MKFELVEIEQDWIVRQDDREVGRFREQNAALGHVAERLREEAIEGAASLSVRFRPAR